MVIQSALQKINYTKNKKQKPKHNGKQTEKSQVGLVPSEPDRITHSTCLFHSTCMIKWHINYNISYQLTVKHPYVYCTIIFQSLFRFKYIYIYI